MESLESDQSELNTYLRECLLDAQLRRSYNLESTLSTRLRVRQVLLLKPAMGGEQHQPCHSYILPKPQSSLCTQRALRL